MADDGLFLLIRFGRDEIQAAKSCWVFDCGGSEGEGCIRDWKKRFRTL